MKFKNIRTNQLVIGSIIIAILLASPHTYYIYRYFPDQEVFVTKYFTLRSAGFGSVRTFAYFLISKITPLIFLVIWFATCKQWWYYAIAVPISLYTFQLIAIINDNNLIDETEFIYTLPITVTVLAILLLLRSKLSVFLNAKDLKKEMYEVMSKKSSKKTNDRDLKKKPPVLETFNLGGQ